MEDRFSQDLCVQDHGSLLKIMRRVSHLLLHALYLKLTSFSGHCLDMLREDLMCSSDVGLVGLSWFNISGEAMPLPKFDTKHQCRNFEAIREWARTEQVIDPPDDYFRQPQPDEIQDGRP